MNHVLANTRIFQGFFRRQGEPLTQSSSHVTGNACQHVVRLADVQVHPRMSALVSMLTAETSCQGQFR